MAKSNARRKRVTLIGGVIAGVMSVGIAGTALATNATDSAQHTSAQQTASSKQKAHDGVSKFYHAYTSAWNRGDITKVVKLKKSGLTKHCNKAAMAWANKHGGDGVLRSQPGHVKVHDVRYNGPFPGGGGIGEPHHSWSKSHPWVVVFLSNGKNLSVKYDVKSGNITNITQ